jgi:serine/threonine protein kinase
MNSTDFSNLYDFNLISWVCLTNLAHQIKIGNTFARKRLMSKDATEFQREANALRRFNGFGNDHMVTLLMTWMTGNTYNLLFPWANSDLDFYWQANPMPVMIPETILWTSKQIRGIASAIESIHNPKSNNLRVAEDRRYGRHGDLKAENILLFAAPDDKRGILVITDLGLAEINSSLSRSQKSNSRINCTPIYKAPESDIDGAKITRSYDIWTFGCLLMEWVCWLFQGYENKTQFIRDLGNPYPNGSITETFFQMVSRGDEKYDVFVNTTVDAVSILIHLVRNFN